MTYVTAEQATDLVQTYMATEGKPFTTQELLDSGAIPILKGFHVKPGKVSDSIFGGEYDYTKNGQRHQGENPPLNDPDGKPVRILVRTERISTHDINRGSIPFKDQILAANHHYMHRLLQPWLGSSQYDVDLPDNSLVIAAENLQQLGFENVLRAYMAKSSTTTSLYQHYMVKGKRNFCGHPLPDDLFTNGPLPYLMDTPSTKSDKRDESVFPGALFSWGLVTPDQYRAIVNSSIASFGFVSRVLEEKGLVAVDTKTEHGINTDGVIVVQDEVWTMDSSRFWLREDYEEQLRKYVTGEIEEIDPRSFSKEFARGFSKGKQGYTDEQRAKIAVRYIEGIQHLLGVPFNPNMRSREEQIVTGLQQVVEHLL